MANPFYLQPETLYPLRRGPFGPYVDELSEYFHAQGYRRATGQDFFRAAMKLSRWLEHHKLGIRDLCKEKLDLFVRHQQGRGHFRRSHLSTMLAYLIKAGVIAPFKTAGIDEDKAITQMEYDFVKYLDQERGVVQRTIICY